MRELILKKKISLLKTIFFLTLIWCLLSWINFAAAQDEDMPLPDAGGESASVPPAAGGESAGGESAAGESTEAVAPPVDSGHTGTEPEPEEPFIEYSPKDKSKEPKDPFKPLIAPPPPVTPPQQQAVNITPKQETKVPPLQIKVTFIVGSESRKVAVLQLNNKTYDMSAGEQEESGLFKVLEITDNKVKIWDSRVQKERDIPLQGM